MVDVNKVRGPSSSPENPGKKDKASADGDKFQKEMHKRVTEVSKIDPDEQKKRKRREEAEEEESPNLQDGPSTPASQVTPFSLGEGHKKPGLMDVQKGGRGTSPMQSAQPTTPGAPPPKRTLFTPSSVGEKPEDSEALEDEPYKEQIPRASAHPPPNLNTMPPPPPTESQAPQPGKWTPEGQKPIAAGPPESTRKDAPAQRRAAEAQPKQEKHEPPKGVAGHKKKPSEGTSAAFLEDQEVKKPEDTSTFFEQMGEEGREGIQKTKNEIEELKKTEAQMEGAAPGIQPTPLTETPESAKNDDKEKLSPLDALGGQPSTGGPIAPDAPSPSLETLPPYAGLTPQVQEIFDRMVGVMTVMNMSGMTETVITLNSPQFASSVFFGTQIIIQEYSTAPQAFNIQLNGTPQAVALIQGNAADLMAAFQGGGYNFRVNRFETGYLSDRPMFKRKEKAEGGKQDQTGDYPQ